MEDKSVTRIKEIKKLISQQKGEWQSHSSFFKPLKYTKTNLDKILTNSFKNSQKYSQLRKLSFRNEIRSLIINSDDIKSFPFQILKLENFNEFECCHLLVHEKGKPEGINYFYNYQSDDQFKAISVQVFNNIFSLIKKSKNKMFNQSLNFKDDLNLVGNFLAKEIELKNHNVICLISRNSFLPPSDFEQEEFLNLCQFLGPILNKLLDREKNDLKKDVLIKSLKQFPEKIYIKDHNRIIFTNDKSIKPDTKNLISFPLGGSDNLTMEISNLAKENFSADIYHSQRISLLGELLNTLQHELSNPLFGLNLTSSLLKSETNNSEALETLNDICQNAIRSQTIIKNFSNLYNDQQEFKAVNLKRLIEETILLTKSESKEIRKEVSYNCQVEDCSIEIITNPTYLTQIIFNLIINAAQAIKANTETYLKSTIKIEVNETENLISIAIIDNGPGIGNDLSEEIFKPFFTTKEAGTGLGLSICKNLATQLNAELKFCNNYPLPGATFSIHLPKIISR